MNMYEACCKYTRVHVIGKTSDVDQRYADSPRNREIGGKTDHEKLVDISVWKGNRFSRSAISIISPHPHPTPNLSHSPPSHLCVI